MASTRILDVGEWREITIIPSTMIASAKYIDRGKKSMIILEIPTEQGTVKLYVKGRAINQFLNRIGVSRLSLKRQRNWMLAQEKLWDGIVNCHSSMVLAVSPQNTVYRVTSEEFTPVPHRILFDAISDTLKELGIEYGEFRIEKWGSSTVARWELPKLATDKLGIYLGCRNANTGNRSIKLFGYYKILVCSNGLISNRVVSSIRIIHKATLPEILKKVCEGVREILGKLPEYHKVIEDAEKTPLSKTVMENWLRVYAEKKLPKEVTRLILRELEGLKEETLFGLSQVITYTGTHVVKRPNWRIQLQELGAKILENPEIVLAKVE